MWWIRQLCSFLLCKNVFHCEIMLFGQYKTSVWLCGVCRGKDPLHLQITQRGSHPPGTPPWRWADPLLIASLCFSSNAPFKSAGRQPDKWAAIWAEGMLVLHHTLLSHPHPPVPQWCTSFNWHPFLALKCSSQSHTSRVHTKYMLTNVYASKDVARRVS